MSCYIRSATVTHDGIVICYDDHAPGAISEHSCVVSTETIGEWYNLVFKPEQLRLYKFLDTMVVPSVETRRLQAMFVVDEILAYEIDINIKISLMNAIKILDKTFTPPYINKRCGWQKELVDTITGNYSRYVIQTCKNEINLKRFFTYVKTL